MAIVKRTLVEIAHYPEHEPRAGPHYRIFHEARHHLIEVMGVGCWIGGATKAQIEAGLPEGHKCHGATGLEAHHNIAEFAALPEVAWQAVAKDFPQLGIDSDEKFLEIAESEGGLLILCSVHHRSPFRGIHSITEPNWKLQKYEKEGWDFCGQ